MPNHPKISAALNNCPLHVLTPELRSDIKSLADNQDVFPDQFKPAYEMLKAEFLAFYLSDKEESCSWKEFHDLIESYNEFDIQILFGPVLRGVMAENIRARRAPMLEGYTVENLEQLIRSKTSLQENGRYESLSPDEVFAFVATNFGLKLTYHQGDQTRTFPDDESILSDFEGRPTVPMFHQGGVEGASAGGHWERIVDEAQCMDYAQECNAHFYMVAGSFRQDSFEVTQAGFDLLRVHVKSVFALQHSAEDCREFPDDFNLTTPPRTKVNNYESPTSGLPLPGIYKQNDNFLVVREGDGDCPKWQANGSISKREQQLPLLPINNDDTTPDAGYMQYRVPGSVGTSSSPSSDNDYVKRDLFFEFTDIDRNKQNEPLCLANQAHPQPVASPWNTYFWLRAMQVFLALGGVCAVIAVLTCPPVAASLGITTVFGVAASEIAVTATFLAGTSALLAASIFAVRLCEGEASSVTPLSKVGRRF